MVLNLLKLLSMVGVAQLVRAPGCGPGGRGFKSHHSPKSKPKKKDRLAYKYSEIGWIIYY